MQHKTAGILLIWVVYMRILICDDEKRYVDELKGFVEKYMKDHLYSYTIRTTTNPLTIINSDDVFDLVLLDIQMEPFNGISVAKEMKKRNKKAVVFFITSYNEYIDDAMDLQAFRYFDKPFQPDRLYSGLDKAMEYIDNSYVDVYVQGSKDSFRVIIDDIKYIKYENRKTQMVTNQGTYITKQNFSYWCDNISNSFFYKVHKSFFVNLHYIDYYKYKEILLFDGTRISVAPRRQSDFRKFWFLYLQKR